VIAAHGGGELVNRALQGTARRIAYEEAHALPRIELSERALADFECIATGVYSPLEGFMTEAEYRSVLDTKRLPSGAAWTIPITLQVDAARAGRFARDQDVALAHPNGEIVGTIHLTDIYEADQETEALRVYGTGERAHPGVDMMYGEGAVYLAGPITSLADIPHDDFEQYRLGPVRTREIFAERGWKNVVAFQTRNPIHRAHEYITKIALESVDGLLIHPLVGKTKSDDIPADVRVRCYETLIEHYYPQSRVQLAVFPAAMRYAGPNEAILHAIARQNYGCTHFIVGRDHAGVGNYYGTYDAQKLFDEFSPSELAIVALKFDNAFFCTKTGQMATEKTSPAKPEERQSLSGTALRAMLAAHEMPPDYVTRPEVAKVLMDAMTVSANGQS
jgi:sulfate adenylyltransferase